MTQCMICDVVTRCETSERAALQIAVLVNIMHEMAIAIGSKMCPNHHNEYLQRITAIADMANTAKDRS